MTDILPQKHQRIFEGIVVSDAMEKTIVVRVDRIVLHPKYKKRYTVSKRYKVHDEKNAHKVGDAVQFVACRPLSKEKRWRVVEQNQNVNIKMENSGNDFMSRCNRDTPSF